MIFFFDERGGIYSAKAFPSPITRMNCFSKTTSSERMNFFVNYGIFFLNLAFPSLVSYAIYQNVHKNRVMET